MALTATLTRKDVTCFCCRPNLCSIKHPFFLHLYAMNEQIAYQKLSLYLCLSIYLFSLRLTPSPAVSRRSHRLMYSIFSILSLRARWFSLSLSLSGLLSRKLPRPIQPVQRAPVNEWVLRTDRAANTTRVREKKSDCERKFCPGEWFTDKAIKNTHPRNERKLLGRWGEYGEQQRELWWRKSIPVYVPSKTQQEKPPQFPSRQFSPVLALLYPAWMMMLITTRGTSERARARTHAMCVCV